MYELFIVFFLKALYYMLILETFLLLKYLVKNGEGDPCRYAFIFDLCRTNTHTHTHSSCKLNEKETLRFEY